MSTSSGAASDRAPGLEVEHLRLLVAVADHGGPAGAAEVLGRRATVVEIQVRRIETMLGARLFVRSGTGGRPTETGVRVLAAARRTLSSLDRMQERLARVRDGRTRLRVCASVLPFEVFVPPLEEALPGTEWEVTAASLAEGVEQVASGAVDLACGLTFPADGGWAPPRGVVLRHVLAESPRLLLPATHELARAHAVALPALSGERWAVPAEPVMQRHLLAACARAGFEPVIAHRPRDLHVVVELVANGHAVAVMPPTTASDDRVVPRECPGLPELLWTLAHRTDALPRDVLHAVVGTIDAVHSARLRRRAGAEPPSGSPAAGEQLPS